MSTEEPPLVEHRGLRLPAWTQRAVDIAVVPSDSQETIRTKRLITAALIASIPTSAWSAVRTAQLSGSSRAGAVLAIPLVGSIAVLLVLWARPKTYPAVMHWIASYNILLSAALVVLFGGLLESGVSAVWGALSVLGAIVVFGDRRAVLWLGVFVVASVVATAVADRFDPVFTFRDPEEPGLVNLLIVVAFFSFLLLHYVRQRSLLLRQSDALLRNVLPDAIVDRLKESPTTIAERFENATILFADVAGFTEISEEMAPEALVSLLDHVFSDFDRLVEERGLEKIKTIGDAYMVAAGVPEPREDHAHAICDVALEMTELVSTREYQGRRLQFRMGINSGEVVAGIIGTHKFSYDLWGDTVNTASRMEAFGLPGRIQVTQATCDLVSDLFVCEPRGVVEVKGKGPMPVWILVGRRL